MDDNPIFKRLRSRLLKFYIEQERFRKEGPSEKQKDMKARLGVDFSYMQKLFHCLKKMLREVINSEDRRNQQYYLKKTYEWFLKQQVAVGLVDPDQQLKENDFLNPQ